MTDAYVAPSETVPVTNQEELPFFAVATHKFLVMSAVTLGIYPYYWMYKQWVRIQRQSGEVISPFWRAFFGALWSFSLFKRVRSRSRAEALTVNWNPVLLGIGFLVVNVLWRLPDPWWLISLFGFVLLVPVQQTIEQLNARYAHALLPNRRYTGLNIVAIVIGGIVFVLAIVGTLMPAASP
jgi:hypothetical protein